MKVENLEGKKRLKLRVPEPIVAPLRRAIRDRFPFGTPAAPAHPEPYQRMIIRLAIAEFAAVAAAAYLASIAYSWAITFYWPVYENIGAAISLAMSFLVIALFSQHYSIGCIDTRHRFVWRGVSAVALAFCFFLSALFLFKLAGDYSRGTFCCQFVAITLAVLCVRTVGHAWLHGAIVAGAVEARRAILLGDAQKFEPAAAQLKRGGILVVGTLALPTEISSVGDSFSLLSDRCRKAHPDDVVFFARRSHIALVPQLTSNLAHVPVSLHVIPDYELNGLGSARPAELGGFATLQVLRPPLAPVNLFIKRVSDIVIATVALVLLSPVVLIAAMAIKLETRGPVFFRQKRYGYNHTIINIIKLRTMHVASEGDRNSTTVKSDPRVTRVGRFVRSTNIDEFPQLLNVLRGEMSIVGPRPHVLPEHRYFETRIPLYSRRLCVKPGITGWAQVNGFRGPAIEPHIMQRRVDLDLFYIDNWSLLFDLKIMVLTFFSRTSYANAF